MIVSGRSADAELNSVKPAEIEDAGLSSFDYLRLTDEDFERLIYALAKRSAPGSITRTWEDAALMVRGADAGRDVLLVRKTGVIQCKRLESQMPLPAVFREIAKLILFAEANGDIRFDTKLSYFLAVARDPAGTVVDFFARREQVEPLKESEIRAAAREVRDSYVTFKGWDDVRVETLVIEGMKQLELHLLRPTDLDEWMGREPSVSTKFFRQRMVVDNEVVTEGFAELRKLIAGVAGDVKAFAPVTDQDLKILEELIEGTPESHRLNLGIAMMFGFPPEMFADDADLELRAKRLMVVLQEITEDYTAWVFKQANNKADAISESAEGAYLRSAAQLLPRQFLGFVAKECLEVALSSDVMSKIAAKVFGGPVLDSDEDRLIEVRRRSLEEWSRYLAGDFSHLEGDADLIAIKRLSIEQGLVGMKSTLDIERALDEGIKHLRPMLFAAADDLRSRCKHKTIVVLTGTHTLDSEAAIKRLADTTKSLQAFKAGEDLRNHRAILSLGLRPPAQGKVSPAFRAALVHSRRCRSSRSGSNAGARVRPCGTAAPPARSFIEHQNGIELVRLGGGRRAHVDPYRPMAGSSGRISGPSVQWQR